MTPPSRLPVTLLLALCSCAVIPAGQGPGRSPASRVLECRMTVNRAIYLENETALLSAVPPGQASPVSKWKLGSHRRELAAMRGALLRCGELALAGGDKDLAGQWLALAALPGQPPEITALAERLRGQGRPATGKSRQRKRPAGPAAKAGTKPAGPTTATTDDAGRHGAPDRARTTAMLARARALYSGGMIAEAEVLWRKVLALAPGNSEAARGLKRARRIKARLRSLANEK